MHFGLKHHFMGFDYCLGSSKSAHSQSSTNQSKNDKPKVLHIKHYNPFN